MVFTKLSTHTRFAPQCNRAIHRAMTKVRKLQKIDPSPGSLSSGVEVCEDPDHVGRVMSFFMQLKTLRRHENGSKLSLGQIANSISHRADNAFCSFQYPSVPAAMLAHCYQSGLFTHTHTAAAKLNLW